MRSMQVSLAAVLALTAALAGAESKNPTDYPLRIHIFNRSQTTFYHREYVDEAKGDGRANLFQNGEAHGVDFSYACSEKLRDSFGYETYPAKWKKPDKELVVLLPVFGKSGSYFTCNLQTDVKDFAYTAHDGRMGSESVAAFKTWMVKHDYDPEHGKNMPVKAAAEGASPNAAPTQTTSGSPQ